MDPSTGPLSPSFTADSRTGVSHGAPFTGVSAGVCNNGDYPAISGAGVAIVAHRVRNLAVCDHRALDATARDRLGPSQFLLGRGPRPSRTGPSAALMRPPPDAISCGTDDRGVFTGHRHGVGNLPTTSVAALKNQGR